MTVITPRPYLYDHPRVTSVPIRDERAVRSALASSWDGVFALQEPLVPEVQLAPWIDEDLERLCASPPAFMAFVTTVENQPVCRLLALAGQWVSDRLGLDAGSLSGP